jgi:hypothetical protein
MLFAPYLQKDTKVWRKCQYILLISQNICLFPQNIVRKQKGRAQTIPERGRNHTTAWFNE